MDLCCHRGHSKAQGKACKHACLLSVVCADIPTTPPAIDIADGAIACNRSSTAGKWITAGVFLPFTLKVRVRERRSQRVYLTPTAQPLLRRTHRPRRWTTPTQALFTLRHDPRCHRKRFLMTLALLGAPRRVRIATLRSVALQSQTHTSPNVKLRRTNQATSFSEKAERRVWNRRKNEKSPKIKCRL